VNSLLLGLYLAGVAAGVILMRDPLPTRVLTALVWPLGPVAFVLVVSLLLVVAAIVWPVTMLGLAAVLGGLVWLMS
jgi:hypothetical protein